VKRCYAVLLTVLFVGVPNDGSAEPSATVADLSVLPLASTDVLQDPACGDCVEYRKKWTTVGFHKFSGKDGGGGDIQSGEDLDLGDDENEWVSGGKRVCWGSPEDKTCHNDSEAGMCDDMHSECKDEGDLALLTTVLSSPNPAGALRDLIATHSSFELARDGGSVIIHGCHGGTRSIRL
jgi:hypothetical protein